MSQYLRLMKTAAVLVLIPSAAALAVAQVNPPKTAVPKGAAAPSAVQTAPVVKAGPVSRPGLGGGSLAPQGVISVLLTADECKNLGGTVNDAKGCPSGKNCVTAGKDGVMHAVCISFFG